MHIIYAQTEIQIKGPSVFLAGPTPRDSDIPSWRPDMVSAFKELGFNGTILVPEAESGPSGSYAFGPQIKWEHEAMEAADIVLFYIPREVNTMPGFTTNIELGYWLGKDKEKIRLGIPPNAQKCKYIRHIAEEENIPLYEDWQSLAEGIFNEISQGARK